MRPGPHSVAQSASVPDAQVVSTAGQLSKQVFAAPATEDSAHVEPAATQASLAQQIWFWPPHAAQLPLSQIVSAAVHLLPVQQAWPARPHASEHACAAPQVSPAMQAPHSMLPVHMSETFPQRFPDPLPQTITAGVQASPVLPSLAPPDPPAAGSCELR